MDRTLNFVNIIRYLILRCCYAGIAHISEGYRLLCDHLINKSDGADLLVYEALRGVSKFPVCR